MTEIYSEEDGDFSGDSHIPEIVHPEDYNHINGNFLRFVLSRGLDHIAKGERRFENIVSSLGTAASIRHLHR